MSWKCNSWGWPGVRPAKTIRAHGRLSLFNVPACLFYCRQGGETDLRQQLVRFYSVDTVAGGVSPANDLQRNKLDMHKLYKAITRLPVPGRK